MTFLEDAGPLIKWLIILAISGVCTVIVYCATALPGLAQGEEKDKVRVFVILCVMITVVLAIMAAAFFLARAQYS